jgi:tetratricopeptide (TPR) repeat protein
MVSGLAARAREGQPDIGEAGKELLAFWRVLGKLPGMTAKPKKLSPLDQALACQQKGDLEGAEAGFRAALVADSDHPDALVLLGALLQKTKRAKEAVGLIERAIEVAPEKGRRPDPSWRVALSFAKRDAGDGEGALEEIESLLKLSRAGGDRIPAEAVAGNQGTGFPARRTAAASGTP